MSAMAKLLLSAPVLPCSAFTVIAALLVQAKQWASVYAAEYSQQQQQQQHFNERPSCLTRWQCQCRCSVCPEVILNKQYVTLSWAFWAHASSVRSPAVSYGVPVGV